MHGQRLFTVKSVTLVCVRSSYSAAAGGLRTCLFRSDQRSLLQPQTEKSLQLGKYCKKHLSRRGHVFASVTLPFCKHSCKQPFCLHSKTKYCRGHTLTVLTFLFGEVLQRSGLCNYRWTNRIKTFDYHESSLTIRNGKENLQVLEDL